MNNIGKLIKSKTISFNETLIRHYPALGLTETEAMVLMVLYVQQDDTGEILSIETLRNKVSMKEEELSMLIVTLVQKGYIELLIDEDEKEKFSIDKVIDKLGELLEGKEETKQDDTVILQEIVEYVEKCYQKVCSSSDLMIINNWLELKYTINDMKEAILDSLKAKKTHLKYADAILANRKKERVQVDNIDEDIKNMLETVYVKRR